MRFGDYRTLVYIILNLFKQKLISVIKLARNDNGIKVKHIYGIDNSGRETARQAHYSVKRVPVARISFINIFFIINTIKL